MIKLQQLSRRLIAAAICLLFIPVGGCAGNQNDNANDDTLRALDAAREFREGTVFLNEKRFDEAIEAFSEAIRLRPEDSLAHYHRGVAYYEKDDLDGAIADFSEAIRLDPTNADWHQQRGRVYLEKGNKTEAYADFAQARKLGDTRPNPEAVEAYKLGQREYEASHFGPAIEHLSKALQLQPDLAAGYNLRGMVRKSMGEFNLALEDTSKAIDLEPEDSALYANRAMVYVALDRHEDALADLDRAIELGVEEAIVFYGRARLRRHLGDLDGAIADYGEAIRLDPDDEDYFFGRGVVFLDQKEHAKAVADFTRAIELNPKNADAYRHRALAHAVTNDLAACLADANKAIELNPHDSTAYFMRASIREKQDDIAGAVVDMTTAIGINPEFAGYYEYRGNLYLKQDEMAKAKADFAKLDELRRDLSADKKDEKPGPPAEAESGKWGKEPPIPTLEDLRALGPEFAEFSVPQGINVDVSGGFSIRQVQGLDWTVTKKQESRPDGGTSISLKITPLNRAESKRARKILAGYVNLALARRLRSKVAEDSVLQIVILGNDGATPVGADLVGGGFILWGWGGQFFVLDMEQKHFVLAGSFLGKGETHEDRLRSAAEGLVTKLTEGLRK